MRGWGHHAEYSLSESEAGALPQDKFHELAVDEVSVPNEEKISHRQQMLVCAKSQRDLYPVEGFIGNTDPCLLAQAHIQLGEAYRSTPGHLRQVLTSALDSCKACLLPQLHEAGIAGGHSSQNDDNPDVGQEACSPSSERPVEKVCEVTSTAEV